MCCSPRRPISSKAAAATSCWRDATWRRHTMRLLECSREGGFGIVADGFGHLSQRGAGASQLLRRDLHAPLCEVVHRRYPDEMNEAIGQRRSRQADFAPKIIHRPSFGDLTMQERQGAGHIRIAQAGEPSGLIL